MQIVEYQQYTQIHIQGETLLILASASGNLLDVRLLVAAGCDVNAKSKYGSTALMEAAAVGFLDCVKFLIKNNADVCCKSKVSFHEFVNMYVNMWDVYLSCESWKTIRERE